MLSLISQKNDLKADLSSISFGTILSARRTLEQSHRQSDSASEEEESDDEEQTQEFEPVDQSANAEWSKDKRKVHKRSNKHACVKSAYR